MKNHAAWDWLIRMGTGVVLSALVPASGQPGGGRAEAGWSTRSAYHSLFNPRTVETFRGTILAIDTFSFAGGGRPGIHLRMLRRQDTVAVHLGPLWYLENQETAFSVRDTVGVKGSRITFDGKPAVIAMEVRKGDSTLVLRDAKGYPVWSGWRGRDSKATP